MSDATPPIEPPQPVPDRPTRSRLPYVFGPATALLLAGSAVLLSATMRVGQPKIVEGATNYLFGDPATSPGWTINYDETDPKGPWRGERSIPNPDGSRTVDKIVYGLDAFKLAYQQDYGRPIQAKDFQIFAGDLARQGVPTARVVQFNALFSGTMESWKQTADGMMNPVEEPDQATKELMAKIEANRRMREASNGK